MSRGYYDDEVARAAPCYCGGCSVCLRDQGYSDEEEEPEPEEEDMPLKLETIELFGEKVRQVICEGCGNKLQVVANDLSAEEIEGVLERLSTHVCPPKVA